MIKPIPTTLKEKEDLDYLEIVISVIKQQLPFLKFKNDRKRIADMFIKVAVLKFEVGHKSCIFQKTII